MDFQEIQKGVIKTSHEYCEEYKVPREDFVVIVKLMEEVGELAEAVLKYKKYQRPKGENFDAMDPKEMLAKELADTCSMVMVLADIYGINLEEAIYKKWITKEWIKLN